MSEHIRIYVVSRRRVVRSPLATGPGFAWKYLYDVTRDGVSLCVGCDRLDSAKNWIGRNAKHDGVGRFAVRFSWEAKSFAPARKVGVA